MSSSALVHIDIVRSAPTALELIHAGRAGARTRGKRVEPWDTSRWRLTESSVAAAKPLAGLARLVEYWSPLYDATPRARPGEELVARLLADWEDLSYERRFFERRLAEARSLPGSQLFRDEAAALRQETAEAPDQGDVPRFLGDAITEWLGALEHRDRGGKPAITMADPARGVWVMENLSVFLMAHWALRHAHGDLMQFLKTRDAAFDDSLGSTAGAADLSGTHDDTG